MPLDTQALDAKALGSPRIGRAEVGDDIEGKNQVWRAWLEVGGLNTLIPTLSAPRAHPTICPVKKASAPSLRSFTVVRGM